jgi:hypothetical protein
VSEWAATLNGSFEAPIFLFSQGLLHPFQPTAPSWNWPGAEDPLLLGSAVTPTPKTTVTPLVGLMAEFSSISISLDISTNRQEMVVVLNRERLVATLVHMSFADCAIMRVVTLGVRQRKPLTEPPHFPVYLRANHHMPM